MEKNLLDKVEEDFEHIVKVSREQNRIIKLLIKIVNEKEESLDVYRKSNNMLMKMNKKISTGLIYISIFMGLYGMFNLYFILAKYF